MWMWILHVGLVHTCLLSFVASFPVSHVVPRRKDVRGGNSGWSFLNQGFSLPVVQKPEVRTRNNPSAIDDDPTELHFTERRRLICRTLLGGCVAPFFTGAIASSNPANADSLPQYPSNRRLGGLPSKIRHVGRIMVRREN